MIPQPLHPAVVHFPMALVVLLPISALAALVLIRRGTGARVAWMPVVALALLLSGSSWVAVQTGENEEDLVEAVVTESAIHTHEEAAELFLPLTVAGLLLAAAGLWSGRVGEIARPVATIGSVLLLVAGYRVGHSGGELVYEHGAAQAYVANSELGVPDYRAEDEDEREERHR